MSYEVAFQGELGAFSEEAVRHAFGPEATPSPRRSFREVAEAVLDGSTDYGLLPIENTLAGGVVGSYDVLAETDLTVVAEVIRPIRHCLLGVPSSRLEDVHRAISHPVALAQCERFFADHPRIEAVAVYDTAGAAREVARDADPEKAAIAARGAAERYGLVILAEDLQDRDDNQTRFLIVSSDPDRRGPPDGIVYREGAMRTVLLFETKDESGALLSVLGSFASRGVNLSKLESRPGDEPWTYRFFAEFEADAAEPQAAAALEEAQAKSKSLRVLGSFLTGR